MEPRLRCPFTMLVAGISKSGKSTLVAQILKQSHFVLDKTPSRIIVCYKHMQPLYEEYRQVSPCPVEFVEGLPNDLVTEPNSLLIFDDLQGDKETVKTICAWFTRKSHHYQTSVIYITQNLFDKQPEHRCISLNSEYLVCFKNARDASQIRHLAGQVFPLKPQLMIDAYHQATAEPHGYLLLDFKQDTPDIYRMRQGLLPGDQHYAFVDYDTVGYRVAL